MNVASFFAGIGGFDLGFERAGFTSTIQCEISEPCQELLADKFKTTIKVRDITAIAKAYRRIPGHENWYPVFDRLRAASVWCGGFPCQDLSVAGQRAGLGGERSGLWFAFRRLIALFRPPWVVIENVPGLLSSNGGRDMFIVVSGLAQLGYRWAYRVLDAQYFGVAQRRERVFIVASLGDFSCAEVLFERESLCWDTPPSRETGKRIAPTIEARVNGGGGSWDFQSGGGGLSKSLRSQAQCSQREDSQTFVVQSPPSGQNTGGGPAGDECYNLVTHSLTAEGHDASEDGTGRGTPIVPIGFDQWQGGDTQQGASLDHAPPVRPHPRNAVAFQPRYFTRENKTGGSPSDISPPVCAAESRSRGDAITAVAFTERTRSDGRNLESQEEVAYALTNPGSGGRTHSRQIATQSTVRRLTPRECERLQGFPDDYTADFSDSQRYRMLGNAVAVPVANWIAERINVFTEQGAML